MSAMRSPLCEVLSPGYSRNQGDMGVKERALEDTLRPTTAEQAETLKRLAKAAYELD
jgi:hypothetical protein